MTGCVHIDDRVEIPGHPGSFIDRKGEVWTRRPASGRPSPGRVYPWRRMTQSLINGYPSVKLDNTRCMVRHLVLEAFVGPMPPGGHAVSLNGNPTDCRLENLAWVESKGSGLRRRKSLSQKLASRKFAADDIQHYIDPCEEELGLIRARKTIAKLRHIRERRQESPTAVYRSSDEDGCRCRVYRVWLSETTGTNHDGD